MAAGIYLARSGFPGWPLLHCTACRVKSPALLPVAFLGLFPLIPICIWSRSPCPSAHSQPSARHPRVMIPRSPRRPSRLFLPPLPPLAPRSLKLIPGHVRPLIFPTSCLLSRSSTCLCGKGGGGGLSSELSETGKGGRGSGADQQCSSIPSHDGRSCYPRCTCSQKRPRARNSPVPRYQKVLP